VRFFRSTVITAMDEIGELGEFVKGKKMIFLTVLKKSTVEYSRIEDDLTAVIDQLRSYMDR
jgi:hypothetical protein